MTAVPARLAIAKRPWSGPCQRCGEQLQDGELVADFADTNDRWPWTCSACTAARVAAVVGAQR